MSKYLKKGPNKYLNIFDKLTPTQKNMQIYSKEWNLHKQIFEYIWGQSLNKYLNELKADVKNVEYIPLKDDILG